MLDWYIHVSSGVYIEGIHLLKCDDFKYHQPLKPFIWRSDNTKKQTGPRISKSECTKD